MLSFLFLFLVPHAVQLDSSTIKQKTDTVITAIAPIQRNPFFVQKESHLISSDSNLLATNITTGAERMHLYLPLLQYKRVGVFSNQTSVVRTQNEKKYVHLIDTLLNLGIQIKKVFVPEHGLMGNADAGESVASFKDSASSIAVVSLYGANKAPSSKDLEDLDVLIFDIQDVGVRFYTYISSLQYLLESAIQNEVSFLLLDRPNPNGFYVDGPILNSKYKSFIGLQKVPIVYGMTVGEYAQMLYFEDLLHKTKETITQGEQEDFEVKEKKFSFTIVPCKEYDHTKKYVLPIKPSPNLTSMQAVYLYPSLCLLEGTKVSLGRGTNSPFALYGFPDYPDTLFSFTPTSKVGAKKPPYLNQKCFGKDLSQLNLDSLFDAQGSMKSLFTLSFIQDAFKKYPNKKSFFDLNFFLSLTGTPNLSRQIIAQESEAVIKASWKQDLTKFKTIRRNYLLYTDF